MNPGSIWWEQIGNSLRLLNSVTECLRDCRPAVLRLPERMPWRERFYDTADMRRSAFSAERRLIRLAWPGCFDPGEFVLKELCSPRVRADYWPGQSCAAYLGSREDLMLNAYDVWVTGIHCKADLLRWTEFVREYERAGEQLEKRAVFLLEYDGPSIHPPGIRMISYTVEHHDCRVFCLEIAAALKNTGLREYQAELALQVSGGDPELCWALLLTGDSLLRDPAAAAQRVLSSERSCAGQPFPAMSEQQITSAAWKSAVVLFFPILEQWRIRFVTRHQAELTRYLPITNSNGAKVTDPFDLEIGSLHYIVGQHKNAFTSLDLEDIQLCRNARNMLAHNKMITCADAEKILNL